RVCDHVTLERARKAFERKARAGLLLLRSLVYRVRCRSAPVGANAVGRGASGADRSKGTDQAGGSDRIGAESKKTAGGRGRWGSRRRHGAARADGVFPAV